MYKKNKIAASCPIKEKSPNMVSVAVVFTGLFFSKMSEAMVQIYFRRYLLIFYQIVQKELWIQ